MRGQSRRGFPTFWFGQAVSQFGDEITLLALPWLLAETTSSPLAVGALEAFAFMPVLFFGLLAGVIADRRSRRRSMLDADLARFVLFASVPIAAWLTDTTLIVHVLAVAFLAGTSRILFEAASQSFLPDLLRQGGIVQANARLSTTEGVAIVVGPSVAGLLVMTFGAATAVAIDSLTFLASFVAIASLTKVHERLGHSAANLSFDLREGIRTIRAHSIVRASTIVGSCANLASGMTAAMLVFFLQQTLGLNGLAAGLVIGANGVGVLVAGRLARLATRALGFGRTMVVGHGVAAIGVVVIASATGAVAPIVAGVGLGLLGLGVVMTIVASVSVRQTLIAGPLLGRVTATYRTALHGGMAVGALLGGVIGEFVGVREALWTAGSLYLVVAASGLLTSLNAPDSAELAAAAA